jgi:dTDP-4-amino-4,6-dideoxygalactose transaminase
VVTSDAALAERIRSLRDHGRVAGSHYDHDEIGTNSRLDAVQAIVLSAKLEHLDRWNAARREIMEHYRDAARSGPLSLVSEAPGAYGVYHLAVARVPRRPEVRHWLDVWGIDTSIHYPTPIHRFGPYERFADRPLPVVEAAAPELLSLPMFPHMTAAQVSRVCDALQLLDELLRAREAVRA